MGIEEAAAVGASSGSKRARTHRIEDAAATPGAVVNIQVADAFHSTDMRLLQAPEEVVAALTAGKRVRVVGSNREQRAVLVTPDSTYELCKVETSNMMLLVPPSESAQVGKAVGNVGYHYEVKKVAPKFDELHRLLGSLGGEGQDDNIQGVGLEELETRVQGSREEIRAKLLEMKAMEMDGRWYAVGDRSVLRPVLEQLLTEALVADMSLDRLPVSECCRLLPDVKPLLVRQCLQVYGTPCTPQDDGNDQAAMMYRLDMDMVAQAKAHLIFKKGMHRPQKAVWLKAAFMMEWEAAMPCKHTLSDTLLQGIALEETVNGTEACWRYLPAEELDLNPEVRLRALFEARKTWALQDLQPYFREVVLPDQMGLQDFLLRAARLTTTAAQGDSSSTTTLYSSK